ncbi:MAG TPA: DUF4349 domain-containing protein, partial [Gemmataceae bacterium]|nr:DUF4349 domain-containing protein [Gemmataceae bacterium]
MRYRWVLILLVVGLVGCSRPAFKREPKQAASAGKSIDVVSAHNFHDDLAPPDHQVVQAMQQRMPGGKNNPPAAPPAVQVARKLIMTGSIALLVDRLDQTERQLQRLLKEQGGYIAQSQVTGSPGSPRQGSWTLRVPADHFEALREAVLGLGEMRENKVDSNDITDQYYDLNARIKTKQQEETRLLELLKKSTGNLKDILAVEEHLTQVRGEIEQMQGQLQRWDKQTALATLTVV